MEFLTTSYELSLRLKELGVEQSNGEYYWVCFTDWQFNKVTMETLETFSFELVRSNEPHIKAGEILCRALTLGELVREFKGNFHITIDPDGCWAEWCEYDRDAPFLNELFSHFGDTPEEAAGELLAELKQKEG